MAVESQWIACFSVVRGLSPLTWFDEVADYCPGSIPRCEGYQMHTSLHCMHEWSDMCLRHIYPMSFLAWRGCMEVRGCDNIGCWTDARPLHYTRHYLRQLKSTHSKKGYEWYSGNHCEVKMWVLTRSNEPEDRRCRDWKRRVLSQE